MRKASIVFMLLGVAYAGTALAQADNGRFKGSIGSHDFDVAVVCSITKMGSSQMIEARTDGNMRKPLEDTNGDGVAGQITGMGEAVTVEMAFGDEVYKFGTQKLSDIHDDGFSWKATMQDYDNEKRRAHLKAGKDFKDLQPEREYDIDVALSCK